ncbi:MAG: LytTR family transcriptional regulator [Rhodobacteraceae bacterium]|nr:LytTR family transcriptional regulator [Paracoccaceae bacterium]
MRERLGDIAARVGPALVVGAVLGAIGPFGTFDLLPLGPRMGYWMAVVALNWILADAIIRRADAHLGDVLPMARVSVPLLGAAMSALPATGVVALAGHLSGLGWPGNVAVLFAQVLLLMSAIALPVYTLEELREAAARTDTGSDAAEGLGLFLRRLHRPPPGAILCLEMQDHYLIVHSEGGRAMILCRMEDAARELAGIGRRVHRSWWVAADALDRPEREGQRLFLRLRDGRRVPVGRSYRQGLKEAGWI